jgi:hypothetical protein
MTLQLHPKIQHHYHKRTVKIKLREKKIFNQLTIKN